MSGFQCYDQWKTASPYDDFDDEHCIECGAKLKDDPARDECWQFDGYCTKACADVVELVNGFMAGYLNEYEERVQDLEAEGMTRSDAQAVADVNEFVSKPDLSRVPERYAAQTDQWKTSYLRGRYGR